MNIGVSTACLYPLETELALESIGKAGVKYTEIFFNAMCELKQSFIDILLDIKDEYEINVVSLHPTMSLAESFMIFSAYDRRYREAEEQYRRYSEIAAQMGAKYIIMHGGKPNGILTDEEYCERYMRLNEVTMENGVRVLQENVVRFRAGDIEFMRSMKNILGNDAAFCFDIKQSIRCGYDPFDLIKEFSENIKHFHISDHSTASDCLLPLDGGFEFSKFFDLLKNNLYNGSCIIEVYRDSYKEYEDIFNSYCRLKNTVANCYK
ncbi:MAG: sugar phosphate isomerase/epimerase [Clostridia bacterium]|nr:sugar phosphate isomerase/epimerase [Clostridia bacterium]